MRDHLAENLFTVDGLLSPAECDDLVRRGEAIGFEPATVATRTGLRTDVIYADATAG